MGVREMTKAKRYDTVVLLEAVDGFQKGETGAAVEVYTMPYEAYDIEIVTDEGKTSSGSNTETDAMILGFSRTFRENG